MYIYPRLRDLREDAELTQEEVAKILGTNQNQYSRWERGEREMPLHNAVMLARIYRVTLDYLTEKMHEI